MIKEKRVKYGKSRKKTLPEWMKDTKYNKRWIPKERE